MNRPPVLALASVCLAAALSSCSGGVEATEHGPTPVTYDLRFSAQGSSGRSGLSCRLQGLVVFQDSLRAGTSTRGRGHLSFERAAYRGTTSVVASDGWSDELVTVEYVDAAHVRIVVEGVLADTVSGSLRRGPEGLGFEGAWACDPRLPFRTDALLLAAGWTGVDTVTGVWSADELRATQ
ncbi:MAG: hypothetical protein PVJ02_11955 [Gemmatimonadota bacterium]|jgi:hypothetical protein